MYSGFNYDDKWGHRAGEPNKAVICSLALAKLRTDIRGDLANSNVVGMAQKLLLFWRKPARRCWWEGVELENVEGVEGKLKVWIRRVWTLEMVCTPRVNLHTQIDIEEINTNNNRRALSACVDRSKKGVNTIPSRIMHISDSSTLPRDISPDHPFRVLSHFTPLTLTI